MLVSDFNYPLPEVVQGLRESSYAYLAAVANDWNRVLGIESAYPATLPEYLK